MILKARKGTQWTFYSDVKDCTFNVDTAHLTYHDGATRKVKFEGTCYLLNDAGQTVDIVKLDMSK